MTSDKTANIDNPVKANKLPTEPTDTFNRFMLELENESDRGAAIFAGTFFECTLRILLEYLLNKVKSTKSLLEEANGGLNTFSAKINICYSLGYITLQEYQALNVLKKIRNQFAHNFEYEFSFEDRKIAAQCDALKQEINSLKSQKFNTARETFVEAVNHLHQKLVDRRYEVATFTTPAFKIESFLDDPMAYQKIGTVQQLSDEPLFLLKQDHNGNSSKRTSRNSDQKSTF